MENVIPNFIRNARKRFEIFGAGLSPNDLKMVAEKNHEDALNHIKAEAANYKLLTQELENSEQRLTALRLFIAENFEQLIEAENQMAERE